MRTPSESKKKSSACKNETNASVRNTAVRRRFFIMGKRISCCHVDHVGGDSGAARGTGAHLGPRASQGPPLSRDDPEARYSAGDFGGARHFGQRGGFCALPDR